MTGQLGFFQKLQDVQDSDIKDVELLQTCREMHSDRPAGLPSPRKYTSCFPSEPHRLALIVHLQCWQIEPGKVLPAS